MDDLLNLPNFLPAKLSRYTVYSYLHFIMYITFHMQILLLLLLRIMYACLAGLPINKISVAAIASALIPYFSHGIPTIQLSARNASQFLIPMVDSSQKHFFFLTSADVVAFLKASEKDMPASSLLKLLYMYGQIPRNSQLFLQEGVFYYAYSVMFQSSRAIEKRLAFSVILMLSSHLTPEKLVQDEIAQENIIVQDSSNSTDDSVPTVTKRSLTDILAELNKKAQLFITTLDQECGKMIFESFRTLLKELEKEHIISGNSQLHEPSTSENVSNLLQNITAILLEGMCNYH